MEPAIDHQDQPAMLRRGWAVTRWVGLVVVCGAGIAAGVAVFILAFTTVVGS